MKPSQMLLLSLGLVLVVALMFRTGGAVLLGFSRFLLPIVAIGGVYFLIKNAWKKLGQSAAGTNPVQQTPFSGQTLDICAKCGRVKGKSCSCRD